MTMKKVLIQIGKRDKYNHIGCQKGFHTADQMFTVRTLIDKYLNQNRKLYYC